MEQLNAKHTVIHYLWSSWVSEKFQTVRKHSSKYNHLAMQSKFCFTFATARWKKRHWISREWVFSAVAFTSKENELQTEQPFQGRSLKTNIRAVIWHINDIFATEAEEDERKAGKECTLTTNMRTSWLHFLTAHFSLNNYINKSLPTMVVCSLSLSLDNHIIYAVAKFFQQAVIQKTNET